MFKQAVETARPADPEAKFMLEADTTSYNSGWPPPPFLSSMFAAVPDLARYVNVVSVHPYQEYGASPTVCDASKTSSPEAWTATVYQFCRIENVRSILDANGAGSIPIWITEIGWSTAPSAENSVTEAAQADYVDQTFQLLQTKYAGLVQGIVWYELEDQGTDPTDQEDYFGLERADGTPKPAFAPFVADARDAEAGTSVPDGPTGNS
jgi:hypothetical protein